LKLRFPSLPRLSPRLGRAVLFLGSLLTSFLILDFHRFTFLGEGVIFPRLAAVGLTFAQAVYIGLLAIGSVLFLTLLAWVSVRPELTRPKEVGMRPEAPPTPPPAPKAEEARLPSLDELLRKYEKPPPPSPLLELSKQKMPVLKDIARLDERLQDAYAGIEVDEATGALRYVVIEPTLSDEEKRYYEVIKKLLVDELDVELSALGSQERAEEYLREQVRRIVKRYRLPISRHSLEKLLYYFARDFIRFGKIDALMHDPMIEDISCDGPGLPVYIYHREYESIPTNIVFESEQEVESFVSKLAYRAGKHISLANPIVDATLPDGSRLQLTYGREVTKKGSTFTIRRFRADPLTIIDLIRLNTLSSELAAYFWYCIEKKLSILVGGGTASGKTTTLNAISMFILPGSKIVSIEDTAELNLPHENWIPSVARTAAMATGAGEITLFDLLRAALRQRPEIIIVGEVRGAEAYTLFQAMATGHGGLGTIHGDSVAAIITRLTSEPMNVPRALIGTSLDIIALQLRIRVGERSLRRIVEVAEVVGLDTRTNELLLNTAFRWDPTTDRFTFTGRSKAYEKINLRYGVPLERIRDEVEDRRLVLEWMAAKGIRSYRDVARVIREFYTDPGAVLGRARLELPA
jgi:flagellar protein FlaI